MKRIAIGSIIHETNTFAPETTAMEKFAQQTLCEGDALIERMRDTQTTLGGSLAGLAKFGYHPVPLMYAAASWQPDRLGRK